MFKQSKVCQIKIRLFYLASAISLVACSPEESNSYESVQKSYVEDIPIIWMEPDESDVNDESIEVRHLVIWQNGFTGNKENNLGILSELTDMGFVAVSFDNFQHGERAIAGDNLWGRVFAINSFRKGMWPIIGQSVEDAVKVMDWASTELNINGDICLGGFSMGGDIAVAVAGIDERVKCVVAIVSTPDWRRPNMQSFGETPTLVQQGEADEIAQAYFDDYNPSTHLENYSHLPAISFESGASDTHIPASDALAFKQDLLEEFPDIIVRIVEHNAGHTLTESMWKNAKDWFATYLQ